MLCFRAKQNIEVKNEPLKFDEKFQVTLGRSLHQRHLQLQPSQKWPLEVSSWATAAAARCPVMIPSWKCTKYPQQIRVYVLVYSPMQGAGSPPDTTCSHRDFGVNLHLPFLVRGVNPEVYMPFILGRYVQSTPTCQNNLKQKSLKTTGFFHHLFHTFLVLKHTVTSSLQHWSPCRSISHQCCRASPSGTSQISPYPPSEIGSSLEVH